MRRPTLALAVTFGLVAALVACGHTALAPDDLPAATANAFDAMDLDHDGRLTRAELVHGLAGLAPATEAREIFARLDRDGDGKLTRAEFYPAPPRR